MMKAALCSEPGRAANLSLRFPSICCRLLMLGNLYTPARSLAAALSICARYCVLSHLLLSLWRPRHQRARSSVLASHVIVKSLQSVPIPNRQARLSTCVSSRPAPNTVVGMRHGCTNGTL